jgi:hypothetical protein
MFAQVVYGNWKAQRFVSSTPDVDHFEASRINTTKDELPVTFVSLRIIVYPAILGVHLPSWIEILGEVHLQAHYKPNVTWVLN